MSRPSTAPRGPDTPHRPGGGDVVAASRRPVSYADVAARSTGRQMQPQSQSQQLQPQQQPQDANNNSNKKQVATTDAEKAQPLRRLIIVATVFVYFSGIRRGPVGKLRAYLLANPAMPRMGLLAIDFVGDDTVEIVAKKELVGALIRAMAVVDPSYRHVPDFDPVATPANNNAANFSARSDSHEGIQKSARYTLSRWRRCVGLGRNPERATRSPSAHAQYVAAIDALIQRYPAIEAPERRETPATGSGNAHTGAAPAGPPGGDSSDPSRRAPQSGAAAGNSNSNSFSLSDPSASVSNGPDATAAGASGRATCGATAGATAVGATGRNSSSSSSRAGPAAETPASEGAAPSDAAAGTAAVSGRATFGAPAGATAVPPYSQPQHTAQDAAAANHSLSSSPDPTGVDAAGGASGANLNADAAGRAAGNDSNAAEACTPSIRSKTAGDGSAHAAAQERQSATDKEKNPATPCTGTPAGAPGAATGQAAGSGGDVTVTPQAQARNTTSQNSSTNAEREQQHPSQPQQNEPPADSGANIACAHPASNRKESDGSGPDTDMPDACNQQEAPPTDENPACAPAASSEKPPTGVRSRSTSRARRERRGTRKARKRGGNAAAAQTERDADMAELESGVNPQCAGTEGPANFIDDRNADQNPSHAQDTAMTERTDSTNVPDANRGSAPSHVALKPMSARSARKNQNADTRGGVPPAAASKNNAAQKTSSDASSNSRTTRVGNFSNTAGAARSAASVLPPFTAAIEPAGSKTPPEHAPAPTGEPDRSASAAAAAHPVPGADAPPPPPARVAGAATITTAGALPALPTTPARRKRSVPSCWPPPPTSPTTAVRAQPGSKRETSVRRTNAVLSASASRSIATPSSTPPAATTTSTTLHPDGTPSWPATALDPNARPSQIRTDTALPIVSPPTPALTPASVAQSSMAHTAPGHAPVPRFTTPVPLLQSAALLSGATTPPSIPARRVASRRKPAAGHSGAAAQADPLAAPPFQHQAHKSASTESGGKRMVPCPPSPMKTPTALTADRPSTHATTRVATPTPSHPLHALQQRPVDPSIQPYVDRLRALGVTIPAPAGAVETPGTSANNLGVTDQAANNQHDEYSRGATAENAEPEAAKTVQGEARTAPGPRAADESERRHTTKTAASKSATAGALSAPGHAAPASATVRAATSEPSGALPPPPNTQPPPSPLPLPPPPSPLLLDHACAVTTTIAGTPLEDATNQLLLSSPATAAAASSPINAQPPVLK